MWLYWQKDAEVVTARLEAYKNSEEETHGEDMRSLDVRGADAEETVRWK